MDAIICQTNYNDNILHFKEDQIHQNHGLCHLLFCLHACLVGYLSIKHYELLTPNFELALKLYHERSLFSSSFGDRVMTCQTGKT